MKKDLYLLNKEGRDKKKKSKTKTKSRNSTTPLFWVKIKFSTISIQMRNRIEEGQRKTFARGIAENMKALIKRTNRMKRATRLTKTKENI